MMDTKAKNHSQENAERTEEEPVLSSDRAEPTGEADEKAAAALAEASTMREQLLRKAAEFENYKRRTEAEFERLMENASQHLIEDLLPVLDDFDRLIKSANEGAKTEVIRDGCSMIAAKLSKVLAIRGLEAFDSVGKTFDVNYHDALLQVPSSELPPNTVVEEVSKGYRLNDKIIRHAKVVVSADDQAGLPEPDGQS
ncbi:MAG: nucleotide exchange factor GrpE [Ignavibacteria bacterium]|nr:nucleotide exchange factor GrpE [Ignavibacteria bacterium]